MSKIIDHWCSIGPEKPQPKGKASFPTGMVGPWVEIFLSPLKNNDGFYSFHKPIQARVKNK